MTWVALGTYKTGRSRTLTFSGSVSGECTGKGGIFGFVAEKGFAHTIYQEPTHGQLWSIDWKTGVTPDQSLAPGLWDYPGGNGALTMEASFDRWVDIGLDCPNGHSFSYTIPYPEFEQNLLDPQTYDFGGNGTWSLVMDAEERATIYIEQDANYAYKYPDYGGTQAPDPPLSTRVALFEVIPPGGTATLTASWTCGEGGGISATQSITGTATCDVDICYQFVGFSGTLGIPAADTPYTTATLQIDGVGPLDLNYSFVGDGGTSGVTDCSCSVTCADDTITSQTYAGTGGGNPAGIIWTATHYQMSPTRSYSISGPVQALADPYPNPLQIWVNGPGTLTPPIDVTDGQISASATQRDQSITASGFTENSWVYSHGSATLTNLEQQPVGCYLTAASLTAANEDPTDWRVPLRGWSYESLQIQQAGSQSPDPAPSTANWFAGSYTSVVNHNNTLQIMVSGPSGCVGTVSRSFPNALSSWEGTSFRGYRWLRLYLTASDQYGTQLDGLPFRLTLTNSLGSKTWTGVTDAQLGYVDIDLCSPTVSDLTDAQDASYPILGAGARRFQDGPYWGVSNVSGMTIDQLANNGVYTLAGVELLRKRQTTLSFLPAFNYFVTQDDQSGQPAQLRIFATGTTDGRRSLEWRDFIRQTVDGVTTYTIEGLGTMATNLGVSEANNQNEGWIVTPATFDTSHSGDPAPPLQGCFLNNGNQIPAVCTFGGGLWYDASDQKWHTAINLPCDTQPLSVQVQFLFDSVDWYPGCGDAFTPNGLHGDAILLHAGKILRGGPKGIVLTPAGVKNQGMEITTIDVPSGNNMGLTYSDAAGLYETGAPHPIGNHTCTVEAVVGTPPYTSVTENIASRHQHRICFKVPPGCDPLMEETTVEFPYPPQYGDHDILGVEEWRSVHAPPEN